jgi:glycosyltransferase involved in cell wall biosynthesis
MRLLLFNLVTDLEDPVLGFTTGWISALAKQVQFVHVITMRAGRVVVPDNVRVYSIGKEQGHSEPRRALAFYRYVFQILRTAPIDVCFSHMSPIFTALAAPLLKAKRVPIITWYTHRHVTTTLKVAHRLSDRMVASAETSYPYKHDKLVIVGHGIDTQLFSPNGVETACPPIILSVGRLSPIKDLMTLIGAIYLLRDRGHDVHCALVGEAPERDRTYAHAIRQRIQELGLEGIVHLVGPVSNDQVVNWYRRCVAHVNGSPPDHSLDKAGLEAMACSKPSLSSTLGFKETFGRWADWLLFRHHDPEDLAGKIESLLGLDSTQRQAMGAELRQRVLENHSLEGLSRRLVDLFEELCQRSRFG